MCVLLALSCGPVVAGGRAHAQEEGNPALTERPLTGARPSYAEYRRSELQYLAARARKGLIGTAVATGVGVALVAPALAKECVRIVAPLPINDLRCSRAGRALLGTGYPLLIGGAAGLIITAIMLGVREGKIRSLDQQIAYGESRAVRWDPARLAFVF